MIQAGAACGDVHVHLITDQAYDPDLIDDMSVHCARLLKRACEETADYLDEPADQ